MRNQLFAVALAVTLLMQSGCAVGFRAGGERGGVGVGAAIGPQQPVVVYPVQDVTPPPPPIRD